MDDLDKLFVLLNSLEIGYDISQPQGMNLRVTLKGSNVSSIDCCDTSFEFDNVGKFTQVYIE